MSIHIGAEKGKIAKTVLLPGDPLRAKYIAETFLENVECYSKVRGMFGFTGLYQGKKVSVQGTGMGQPSAGIYINELINFYDVENLIRIGSCGSLQANVKVRDIVVVIAASTNSNMNKNRFKGYDYAAIANSDLLFSAYEYAKKKNILAHFGNVFSSDVFYEDNQDEWKMWANYGVKAVEMEASQLYTLAAKYQKKALCILTVSDSLVTHEETTSEEREKTFNDMITMALEIVEK